MKLKQQPALNKSFRSYSHSVLRRCQFWEADSYFNSYFKARLIFEFIKRTCSPYALSESPMADSNHQAMSKYKKYKFFNLFGGAQSKANWLTLSFSDFFP